jgi:hypothetical protein
MPSKWKTSTLASDAEVLAVLLDLRGRQWLHRGQSRPYGSLVPSIDRDKLASLPRAEKLARERSSINLFRATARFFSSPGEQAALTDDFITLMILRHHEVPTRLLDWSQSPYVAAYFAVAQHDKQDGELWTFDRVRYEALGKDQWRRWPETTTDGTGDDTRFSAGLTGFAVADPPDWVIACFYPEGFPRQNSQSGAYTLAAQFGRDHADLLRKLLNGVSHCHRYVIPAKLKPLLRRVLREEHGIWRGALFPDSAGAAQTAISAFR